jgi:hypothetical protein
MYFTVEEENFICGFENENRERLIRDMKAFSETAETDMRDIAESAINKVRNMPEDMFREYTFCLTE